MQKFLKMYINTSFRIPVYLCFALLLLTGCKLALVAPYSQQLYEQTDNTAKLIDRFYLNMLEKTDTLNNGRAYSEFTDGYIDIEVELNSLYTKNRIRPLNRESARNCEIALKKWIDYKEAHKKKNTISDGIIILNKTYMNDLFYTIRVAEEAKK